VLAGLAALQANSARTKATERLDPYTSLLNLMAQNASYSAPNTMWGPGSQLGPMYRMQNQYLQQAKDKIDQDQKKAEDAAADELRRKRQFEDEARRWGRGTGGSGTGGGSGMGYYNRRDEGREEELKEILHERERITNERLRDTEMADLEKELMRGRVTGQDLDNNRSKEQLQQILAMIRSFV
jgi:hypothetical protein